MFEFFRRDLSDAQKVVSRLQKRIAALESDLATCKLINRALASQVRELQGELEEAEQVVFELEGEIEHLEREFDQD